MGCIVHAIFLVLRVLAFLFGFVFLFVTVPAHLLYIGVTSQKRRYSGNLGTAFLFETKALHAS